MSNIIPPLISDSPPPPPSEEDEDEEYDDFRGSNDISYGCDNFSLSPSPEPSPKKASSNCENNHDFKIGPENTDEEHKEKSNHKVDLDSVEPLKQINSELSCSESSDKDIDITSNIFHKNNLINEDNIPSQFIIEGQKVEHENDVKCDKIEKEHNKTITNGIDEPKPSDFEAKFTEFELKNTCQDVFLRKNGNSESDLDSDLTISDDKKEKMSIESVKPLVDDNCIHSTESSIEHDLIKTEIIKKDDIINNSGDLNSPEKYNFEENSIDDFGDFIAHPVDENSTKLENQETAFDLFSDTRKDDENDDDFANFSSFPLSSTSNQAQSSDDSKNDNNVDDFPSFASFPSFKNDEDFDDFTSFEKTPTVNPDDDFDDFGEFTSTTLQKPETSKPFLLLDEKEAYKKTEEIIKDIFKPSDDVLDDFQYFELGKGDDIFTQLQDVTDTPALGYHWSKSASQKLLLRALNIDSRNILYGHSWNPSMPRFASNLGVQPLEPVKMEPLTPTPVEPPPTIVQNAQSETVEVPSAQFDWTSSGLVNPLDYPPKSTKPEPTSSSQHEDDYEEFTSFQSTKPSVGWPALPLRETYISDVPQAHIDVDVVLQPTIVTPELPRKIIGAEDVAGFVETLPENKSAEIEQHEEESCHFQKVSTKLDETKSVDIEEFDDFQMVYPDKESENVKNNNVIEENKNEEEDDDDFTEFHSSVPVSQTQPQATSILLPTPVHATPNPTQINWPDPGITQDELKRFEEAFSLPVDQKKGEKHVEIETKVLERVAVQPSKKEVQRNEISIWDSPIKKPEPIETPKKLESKQNSVEDDEWSDFICVQKPSPIHKTKLTDRTQTSSPDLPLSVLNLGSIQPTKQPIPVITPQGLVQTKLSTNMNPMIQPKLNMKPSYSLPQLQPSIISNQYVSQAYNFSKPPQSSQITQNGQDDDEWGEFVSSPLPPQYQNSSTTVGWSNLVPNIRSNPYQASARSVNTNLQKKSNNLSGLVLPELDFLALKERSGVPRKK